MTSVPQQVDRPNACPVCGCELFAAILYGLPGTIDIAALDAGHVVLGGCCIRTDSPAWRCTSCGHGIEGASESVLVTIR